VKLFKVKEAPAMSAFRPRLLSTLKGRRRALVGAVAIASISLAAVLPGALQSVRGDTGAATPLTGTPPGLTAPLPTTPTVTTVGGSTIETLPLVPSGTNAVVQVTGTGCNVPVNIFVPADQPPVSASFNCGFDTVLGKLVPAIGYAISGTPGAVVYLEVGGKWRMITIPASGSASGLIPVAG
jgi:hypothetical protein